MTSADRNDLMPAQEKLEWVTPKISLMDTGETQSKNNIQYEGWQGNLDIGPDGS
jgi:hypothetical protein